MATNVHQKKLRLSAAETQFAFKLLVRHKVGMVFEVNNISHILVIQFYGGFKHIVCEISEISNGILVAQLRLDVRR